MPLFKTAVLLGSVATLCAAGGALSQTPVPTEEIPKHLLEWESIYLGATAQLNIQDAEGETVREVYGVVIGEPPTIITSLASLVGGTKVIATFRDGSSLSTESLQNLDLINGIAILETDGQLPRPADPDETMKWRFQERVYVIPGPGMDAGWSSQTTTTPLELGQLKIAPITGDHPAGLSVIHECGRWVGFTGRITDETGSYCFVTTIDAVLPTLFGEARRTSISQVTQVPPIYDGSTIDGLLARAIIRGQQDPEEAKPLFDLALAKDPDLPEVHFWYGKILFRATEFEPAERAFREAIRLRSGWEDAYQMAGASANQQGNYAVALELYDQGLATSPRSTRLLINKWGALYNLGRNEEALAVLKTALEIDPSSDLALYNLGTTYLRVDRRLDAEEVYANLEKMGSRFAAFLREKLDQ